MGALNTNHGGLQLEGKRERERHFNSTQCATMQTAMLAAHGAFRVTAFGCKPHSTNSFFETQTWNAANTDRPYKSSLCVSPQARAFSVASVSV